MSAHGSRPLIHRLPKTLAAAGVALACVAWLVLSRSADAASLLSQSQARTKAIAILRGDPYGKTDVEVMRHIKETKFLPDGKPTPCGDLHKPAWKFHVVVFTRAHKINGYLILDARTGKMLCTNLPLLD